MSQNDVLRSFTDQLKINPRMIKSFVILVIVLLLLFTSWFTVGAEEVGVILRLGKFSRTVNPGLHFKIPFGVEQVFKVPVQRQLKEEFGFRTLSPGVRSTYDTRNYEDESVMLTGDLNVAVVEWTVQYRIDDPYKYLFRIRNARSALRDMTEATMREVIGNRTVAEILTIGRAEVASTVKVELQKMANSYETGFRIDQVVLQNVMPPEPVRSSFNEVNEAQQDREKLINQAKSEYNRVIPKAKGQAQQTIQEAEGYALNRVNSAKGHVAMFNAVFEEYRKAPDVTRQRIYLETMNEILPQLGKKYVIDEDVSGILPLLNLDK
ncbi:MAG: FtsH protease activity modulator HflK [Candidatus Neomarinimicrobiota bacterium]|nr:FtsH protease activity modulator HflK [Candidatus Neomarinimicrobiota bacterium]RKY51379.1 MAG: FtsH protease activity modulator HflK [Candidatus Neomarinimicrobiota bacterium]